MKQLLCITLVAVAVFIQSYECNDQLPQIKMIRPVLHYFNKEYVKELVYTVTPHNETYNNMKVHWVIKKDLPVDVALYQKVYVLDSTESGKLVLDNGIAMCRENKNRHLLPKIDVLPKSTMGTKCVKKGTYDEKDMGQTRFEVLVPNIAQLGKYYRVDYRMGTDDVTVLSATFYSKFGGYVHN